MGKGRAHVVLLFAVAMLLAMALPALATTGPGGYIDWDDAKVLEANAGATSPHGGYTTTTAKCAVCHAVHGAAATGTKLLQGGGTCDYCHVDTNGAGYSQVYGGDMANHDTEDLPNAHNKWYDADLDQFRGVGCTDCHQVHGATRYMSGHEYLDRKILTVSVDSELEPFWDVILGAPASEDSSGTAIAKYCAACHANIGGLDGYSYTDSTSHVMTDTFVDSGAGQVAWEGTQYCASCHASGYETSAWPHYTPGNRFLLSGADATSATDMTDPTNSDGACLRCHAGDAQNGVGVSF